MLSPDKEFTSPRYLIPQRGYSCSTFTHTLSHTLSHRVQEASFDDTED